MAAKPTPQAAPQKAPTSVAPKLPPPASAPSLAAQQKAAQASQVAAAVAPAPIVAPPPTKIPLEETVRKAVEARKGSLVNLLETEHKAQVIREDEVRKGRTQIDLLTAEIADIDAFLARS